MIIKTRKRTSGDKNSDPQNCAYCDKEAAYWSQKEDAPIGRAIFHCQKHRQNGRARAMTAKIDRTSPDYVALRHQLFADLYAD